MRSLFLVPLVLVGFCQSAFCAPLTAPTVSTGFTTVSMVADQCSAEVCPVKIEVVKKSATTCEASVTTGALKLIGPDPRVVKLFIAKCPSGKCEFDKTQPLTIDEDLNSQVGRTQCAAGSCQLSIRNNVSLAIVHYTAHVHWTPGTQDIPCDSVDPIIINDRR